MKLTINKFYSIALLALCINQAQAVKLEDKKLDFNKSSGLKGFFFSDDDNDYSNNAKSQVNAAKAAKSLKEAKKLELAKDYRDAADKYLEVRLYSDINKTKAKAVQKAAECYEKAGLLFEQFKCLERLIKSYPHYVDFAEVVDKQFAIADKFFAGHRDPEFYSLRWVPWLTGEDKSAEIYEKAIANAPFSKYSAQATLRLAKMKVKEELYEDAMKLFRKVIYDHSKSKSAEFAYLEMIMLLTSLSKSGDGDGRMAYEAIQLITSYKEKYPNSKEIEWVDKQLIITKNNAARRLYNIAKFYKRYNNEKAAKDYLEEIIQRYDTSKTVVQAEDMLSSIDPNFELSELPPKIKSEYIPYQKHEMLSSPRKILIVPENSNNKWLLPIRDLGIGDKDNLSDSEENERAKKELELSDQLKRELLSDEYNNKEKKQSNSSLKKSL
ncbi:outer membrane protein assembly factor BamD [Lentisphaerota bacterium WC36G]|nr:outer membrane protein assembly factor BamD [Lentisphaerae bacterium WC36]